MFGRFVQCSHYILQIQERLLASASLFCHKKELLCGKIFSPNSEASSNPEQNNSLTSVAAFSDVLRVSRIST